MSYDKLRVAKPFKQLVKVVELYTRHIPKENREQWREAKRLIYCCFGSLIRASEEWESAEKDDFLRKFLDNFAVFRGMVQIMTETKVVSIKKASEIASLTAQIRPQIASWRKTIERDSVSSRPDGESNI